MGPNRRPPPPIVRPGSGSSGYPSRGRGFLPFSPKKIGRQVDPPQKLVSLKFPNSLPPPLPQGLGGWVGPDPPPGSLNFSAVGFVPVSCHLPDPFDQLPVVTGVGDVSCERRVQCMGGGMATQLQPPFFDRSLSIEGCGTFVFIGPPLALCPAIRADSNFALASASILAAG